MFRNWWQWNLKGFWWCCARWSPGLFGKSLQDKPPQKKRQSSSFNKTYKTWRYRTCNVALWLWILMIFAVLALTCLSGNWSASSHCIQKTAHSSNLRWEYHRGWTWCGELDFSLPCSFAGNLGIILDCVLHSWHVPVQPPQKLWG